MIHIIGERYRAKLAAKLSERGVSVLWLPDNPSLDTRLSGHADLSVFMPNDRTVVAAEGATPLLVNFLTNRGVQLVSASRQGECYPLDAGLCACRTGKYVIYNKETIDPIAEKLLDGIPVHVTQGYTKCSTCVVSEDAIITADNRISKNASAAGMDVLHIQPGHIRLEGFPYGFIGGATFNLDEKTLAFTGTLDSHPDKDAILAFLEKYHVEPVFLSQEAIFDVGGAVALP